MYDDLRKDEDDKVLDDDVCSPKLELLQLSFPNNILRPSSVNESREDDDEDKALDDNMCAKGKVADMHRVYGSINLSLDSLKILFRLTVTRSKEDTEDGGDNDDSLKSNSDSVK